MPDDIAANIAAIRDRIDKVCGQYGRDPAGVNLVAVTKTQSAEKIRAALTAGQRLFGENRVQEAKAHWESLDLPTPLTSPLPPMGGGIVGGGLSEEGRQTLRSLYPDVKLHLIGPLQTNKVKEAVALFDCIETLDRPALVAALAKEMEKQGRRIPCFIQVNTGAEPQKAGVSVEELPALLKEAQEAGLQVTGLMCIPPADEPPAPHFSLLQKLAQRHGLKNLSMGMSGDFEKAIPLGATHVRIGTALFGERG